MWEYQIGAYQVMAKYLKDRKKRELSLEDIGHYRRVAKAIERTIEVQGKVDIAIGINLNSSEITGVRGMYGKG